MPPSLVCVGAVASAPHSSQVMSKKYMPIELSESHITFKFHSVEPQIQTDVGSPRKSMLISTTLPVGGTSKPYKAYHIYGLYMIILYQSVLLGVSHALTPISEVSHKRYDPLLSGDCTHWLSNWTRVSIVFRGIRTGVFAAHRVVL